MHDESLPVLDRKITLLHRIEHAGYSLAVKLSRAAGPHASERFGSAVGALGYWPFRIRRKVAEAHLRLAFPEKDERWIRETARASYAHLGREALVSLELASMSQEEIIQRTRIIGDLPALEADLALGKGVVMVSGHVGNHEIAAAALAARGIPVDVVVQRQGNPLFDEAINAARRRHGIGVIDRFRAQRAAIRSLRQGRLVAFAADQNAGKGGAFVPFFGRLASTHKGPALFALRAGAPFWFGAALRTREGYEVGGCRLEVDRDGETDDVVRHLTAAFTARLEEVVRSAPDQYLWQHRRWKTRPPEERNP